MRLELTERVERVARLRYLFDPAAGGRGMAETVGESMRATFAQLPADDLAGLLAVHR